MEAKRKALIIIGCSYLQHKQLIWAKELNLYVVGTDRNPNAYGRHLVDQFEVISGDNLVALIDIARRVSCQYDLIGVYGSSDFALKAVSVVCAEFRLPGVSLKSLALALDKSKSKTRWLKENLPVPNGFILQDYSALETAVDKLAFPLVVKPTNSCGSQGVISANKPDQLKEAYAKAKKYVSTVLVEELVAGRHIDANGLFTDGKFYPCGVMERFFGPAPYHCTMWGCQPSALDTDQEETIYALLKKAANVLEIKDGPVKGDFIWTDNGPVILELTPRFHGDVITSFTTPLLTGFSPIAEYFSFLAGYTVQHSYPPKTKNRFGGWRVLYAQYEGILEKVVGLEVAVSVPGVKDIYISVSGGAHLKKPIDNSCICGFIWAVGGSLEELKNILDEANSVIEFHCI